MCYRQGENRGDKQVRITLGSVTPALTSFRDTERDMIGLQVEPETFRSLASAHSPKRDTMSLVQFVVGAFVALLTCSALLICPCLYIHPSANSIYQLS